MDILHLMLILTLFNALVLIGLSMVIVNLTTPDQHEKYHDAHHQYATEVTPDQSADPHETPHDNLINDKVLLREAEYDSRIQDLMRELQYTNDNPQSFHPDVKNIPHTSIVSSNLPDVEETD